jgi:hypothetical protein
MPHFQKKVMAEAKNSQNGHFHSLEADQVGQG